MKNRFYVVGAPIEDLKENSFFGVSAKKYTLKQLDELSFHKEDSIRVFISYNQAKEYSHGLRENAHDYSHYPKTSASRSQVRPVFTIELDSEVKLGEIQSEQFKYTERYVDENRFSATRNKEVHLDFFKVPSNLINKSDIIRAEFYNSFIDTVEFIEPAPSRTCLIS